MAQSVRQNELLAGEDWKVIYRAFTDINFNAYDFHTIRQSMVDYIRRTYPEDFNDWIESSEFVFLLDLIAYLGEQLAFRFDLNVREAFIDTAERKESILRLARMLSYNARRNQPAEGMVKIEQIVTTENITDSNGRNLANRRITWNDLSNPDWYEQWVLVLNSAFTSVNPFGRPIEKGTVFNNRVQLYALNNVGFNIPVVPFSTTVDNKSMQFELVNVNFRDGEWFFERTPLSNSQFNLFYMSDGLGNNSNKTGFFFYFKQGTLQYYDFYLSNPLENRVVDIDAKGINENDVWLQEVTETGEVLHEWTKVPTVYGENVIYNSVNRETRKIYTVVTGQEDTISLRFADGRFGEIPTGFFRCWYRTSNGLTYRLRPQDVNRKEVTLRYYNEHNETHELTFVFSLKDTVSNSRPAETTEEIRQRAPKVYYSQNRMVTGEDYNNFPQRSNVAQKIKAVNRVYSGHSRYIDINDPTGNYQNTNVFSDDGILYREIENSFQSVSLSENKSSTDIILQHIQPMLTSTELKNFFQQKVFEEFRLVESNMPNIPGTNNLINWQDITWTASESVDYNHTGAFSKPVGRGSGLDLADYIREGCLICWEESQGKTLWTKVLSITNDGNNFPDNNTTMKGEVVLDKSIETSARVIEVRPVFRTTLTTVEFNSIKEQLDNSNTFAIRYNIPTAQWVVVEGNDISHDEFSLSRAGTSSDSSWLLYVEYNPTVWNMTSRGMTFVFESVRDVRFFHNNKHKVYDLSTGRSKSDIIKILKSNPKPGDQTTGYENDFVWAVYDEYVYPDGHIEPRRIKITLHDADGNGIVDNPLTFNEILGQNVSYVFWEKYTENGYEYKRPITDVLLLENKPQDTNNLTDGQVIFVRNELTFYTYDEESDALIVDDGKYSYATGRANLIFQWKHYAPRDHRIDPAITNIIDIYVLTKEYDSNMRKWIANGAKESDRPLEPTEDDLRVALKEFDDFKMVSDHIVWKPVKYKLLFGQQAPEELRATFKVVKLDGATLSDGEVRSRVIQAINDYFDVSNWDFGETFFFTELSAFIHQQLATSIASIVIVPENEESQFGNLFQVKANSDELFLSCATVDDVIIVDSLNESNLRIK